MSDLKIRRYSKDDDNDLFDMICREGDEWKDYWNSENIDRCRDVLNDSEVFVAHDKDGMCGYVRCRRDGVFGIYIYDLLVTGAKRGNNTGRALIDHICSVFPDETVYMMSDIDEYCRKQGYPEKGRIFTVRE
jgi:hypothetical protein